MYKITDKTGKLTREEFNKINIEIINYFFSKTKLSNKIIDKVDILKVNDDNELVLGIHLSNIDKNFHENKRRFASLNISLTKIIVRDRDNKLNTLFYGID